MNIAINYLPGTQFIYWTGLLNNFIHVHFLIAGGNIGTLEKALAMTGLKGKGRMMPKLLIKADPTETSNNYGSVIMVEGEGGQLSICIYKGFTFKVASLLDALCCMLTLFYVLNIKYPSQCSAFLSFLGILHGEKGTVKNTMKELIAKL